MAEDPPRRNTLRMGALPEPMPEPRAPHPASVTRAGPQRYVLLGEGPSRRKSARKPAEDEDDPTTLFEELSPHLGWLPEDRRPELRRWLLRGELERALTHFEEEHARFPRNLSVERCQKITERALLRRLTRRLAPSERVPVMTGELPSHKPRDPRALVVARIDGVSTVEDILRDLSLPRLKGLLAFDALLSQGLIAWKSGATLIDEPAVSERPTLADPIESAAIAALTRPGPSAPAPAPEPEPPTDDAAIPESAPIADAPIADAPSGQPEAEPPPEEAAAPPAHPSSAPAEASRSLASTPPPSGVKSTAPMEPPDNSRRLVTALVGTTGVAVGIAVVAIVFAMRGPASIPPASAPTQRATPTASAPRSAAPSTPSVSTSAAPAPPAPTIKLTMEVSPNYARVYLDKARLKAPYELSLPRDGAKHELKIEAPGHKTRRVPFEATADLALVVALEVLPKKKPPPAPNEDIY